MRTPRLAILSRWIPALLVIVGLLVLSGLPARTAPSYEARTAAGESRAPNLFQRITGAFSAPRAAPAPMPQTLVDPSAARAVAPENVVPVAPKPVPKPVAQPSMNLDVTERAKPARDDDDLQIPAFLRRQAN